MRSALRLRHLLAVLIASTALALVAAPAATAGDAAARRASTVAATPGVVREWNAIAGQAALDACLAPANNPLHESRLYAAVHIAVHDGLNAIDRRSEPYAFAARRRVPTASPDATVATAARDVLVELIGQLPPPFAECAATSISGVESAYTAALGRIGAGTAKEQGVRLGRAAAAAILALRTGDGSDTLLFDPNAPQGTEPGEYRFTEPFPFGFGPGWGDVTPFALRDSTQFSPGRPYRVTSRRYAADLAEVKRLGRDTSTARTADQTEIALFWFESAPLMWNRIAKTVSASTPGQTAWDDARLFGLLNVAMADGYIGSFETKWSTRTWRPVTAIREAGRDGNPRTAADPTWAPLLDTPPIPSYDSAHAVEGAAAAGVLRRFFGTDRRSFRTCSFTLPAGSTCADGSNAVQRSFTRFSQAAGENGVSRILVGIHFRQDVEAGLRHGRRIADRAVRTTMRPR